MALAAFAPEALEPEPYEEKLLRIILDSPSIYPLRKAHLRDHPLYNIGVEHPAFARMARLVSDAIYRRFAAAVERHFDRALPLVLAGGCALNCEWNTRFRAQWCADVFVPPCPN